MRENINKVSQRGERLDSLQDKTDNLATSAQGFRRGANRVRKQMWWKDMKMRMWLIVGIIVLLIIIIVPAGESDRCHYPRKTLTSAQLWRPPDKSTCHDDMTHQHDTILLHMTARLGCSTLVHLQSQDCDLATTRP